MSQTATQAAPAGEKLDFKRVLPIFVIVLIDLLGLTIIIPLLPLYAAAFGANAFVVGALGAAYPMMQFVGAPLLGRLSDRYGRRPVLIVSQIGTFAGFVLLGLANTLWVVFLARLLDGLSGANISTAQAAISDSTTEKTRTQGLGLIGAAFGLGFIIGPVIAFAVLAVSDNNYSMVAYTAAVFSLISILLTVFWFKETLPAEKRGTATTKAGVGFGAMLAALKKPQVGFLLALMFMQQFAFGGFEQLLSLFTLNRLGMNASSNATLFVFAGVIIVVVQGGMVGRWSRQFGDRWLIFMGLLTVGVGLMLAAATPAQPVPWYSRAEVAEELSLDQSLPGETPPTENIQIALPEDANKSWLGLVWLMVAIVPIAIGGGVLQPSINSMLTQRVGKDEIGGTLGVSAAFLSASNALTPLILGAIFQWLGASAPFLIGGVILLALWGLARRNL
ncbi:MAG: MFS transporter [Anaerolineales bacterium]|nr:MFS transporter [Anaerolineales bacterium]